MDYGNPTPPGDAAYDSQTGEYRVTGGGAGYTGDMHIVYTEVSGDFRFKARVRAEDLGGSDQDWAMAGIFIDDSLVPGAHDTHYWECSTINDMLVVRWDYKGTYQISRLVPASAHDGRVEIVREGNRVTAYYIDKRTEQPVRLDSRTVDLTDPVVVGLQVVSFRTGGTTVGYFTDVELITAEPSAVEDWAASE